MSETPKLEENEEYTELAQVVATAILEEEGPRFLGGYTAKEPTTLHAGEEHKVADN